MEKKQNLLDSPISSRLAINYNDRAENNPRLVKSFPSSPNFNVLKEDWLEKRSRYLKVWRKRWVILTPRLLLTFKNQTDFYDKKGNPTERIYLRDCLQVTSAEQTLAIPLTFQVQANGDSFYFKAEESEKMYEWMEKIQEAMKMPLIASKIVQ